MPIDLGAPESLTDPAGFFAALLDPDRGGGDVHRHGAPAGWAIVGHEAVAEAFRDAETLSADRVGVLERVAAARDEDFGLVVELLSGWTIFRDPPAHTRLRAPVRDAFTRRRTRSLAGRVEAVVEDAVDDMVRGAVDGVADLTGAVARPVPALVVGELLGVDPDRRPLLQAWSDDLAAIVFSLHPSATPPAPVVAAARSFHELFGDLVDRARGAGDDSLVARIADLDASFTRTELVGLCTMLLFAGHETTTSVLQSSAVLLAEDPALAAACADPDADLDPVVEELLRVAGPARTMVRKASVDHERAGVAVRAGENVLLSIAGANHDPRTFTDPGRHDWRRDPNPHLSFGWGLHHCLGAHLARLEVATFLRVLRRRVGEVRLARPSVLHGNVLGSARGPVLLDVSEVPT